MNTRFISILIIVCTALFPHSVFALGLLNQEAASVQAAPTVVQGTRYPVQTLATEDGERAVDLELVRTEKGTFLANDGIAQLFPGTQVLQSADGNRIVLLRSDGSYLTLVKHEGRLFIEFMGELIDSGFALHDDNGRTYLPLNVLAALYGQEFTISPGRCAVNNLAEKPQWLTSSWDSALQSSGQDSYQSDISEEADNPNGKVFTDIVATVFSSEDTGKKAAYGEYLQPEDIFVALPHRFKGKRPKVAVRGPSGTTRVAEIKDVGPWNISDPYWLKGSRPQAETGTDKSGRRTNKAGIDLSPRLGRELGIGGKGKVDWWFVE